jgi:hypothetical protein
MFERYTEKARCVIFFARYAASQFGSPYIEPEHLLLGLLREDKALLFREVADLFESFEKGFVDLLVSLGEFGGHFVQEGADSVFRERHDPGDNPAGPLGILRTEGPQKDA